MNKILNCIFIFSDEVVTNNSGPNLGSRLHLLSNFNMVAEQANKLGIGRTMSVTSQYNDYQVIILIF